MEMRRARNENQKQARRQTLLNAASELFSQTQYEAVTMAEVALKSGLAKGTLFLYFKTKEELFLEVLEQLLDDWFEDVDNQLKQLSGNDPLDQVITLFCASLEGRDNLTRLLSILHTTLEQNTDFAAIYHFKQFLRDHLIITGELLEQRLSFLKVGQGAGVITKIDALIIGLYHQANPGPIAQKVLQEPDMQVLAVNFSEEFTQTLRSLLHGLQYEAEEEARKL